ncbi:MAG: metalloregulator ArsR/SmtB family transcription factor [Candidatus Micrarchaeota archaeon]
MDESNAKIVLDAESFKALSSDTRVSILKKLNERKMTASELSTDLEISVQAVSTHLATMEKAGLVSRVESHRKWVYYELTEKGLNIVSPGRKAFLVVLSVLALFAVVLGAFIFTQLSIPIASSAVMTPPVFDRAVGSGALTDFQSILIAESNQKNSAYLESLSLPDGTMLSLELAVSPAEKNAGLSNRNELCSNCGMLFLFNAPSKQSFWMRDVLLPLDLVFLNDEYMVVDAEFNAQPCLNSYCPLIVSSEDFSFVLETNAGFAEQYGLVKGAVVSDLNKFN